MFYRCKSCGGNVVYHPEKKRMVCESCGNEEQGERVPQEKLHVCNNCGAALEMPDNAMAFKCPYCGTYIIYEDRMEGEYEPKLLLPFAVSRNQATEIIRKNFANKIFIPKDFCRASSLEKMEGLYVPFFMYDMETRVHFEGEGDKIRTWREGDYECTEVSVFHLVRDFEVDFDKIPVDASADMPDDLMDLAEPYRYEDLGKFAPEYLSGFSAQVYDEDEKKLWPRARQKAEKFANGYLQEYNSGYSAVRPFTSEKKSRAKETNYTFLPVWRYVYRFQNKEYEFLVNGQTGKAVGKPPVSRQRAVGFTLLTGFAVFFALEMLLYFMTVL